MNQPAALLTPSDAQERKHVVLGTAGHVDHGKTTLVKALTGVDTDRLPEEKLREMTIDLGFARMTLPSGRQASIIDVPGHERFVGNMLAGATGVDLVLLVVAADEGVMPQTLEHLDILDLLEVDSGIVVLTKADLVDDEMLELVQAELESSLEGTFLAKAPVVPVSARTGKGLPELLRACDAALDRVQGKFPGGPARLAIDRVFTAPGFGTVVTGTLLSGRMAIDDRLELLPAAREVRVRALEVHGERRDTVLAGERVAINLAGLPRTGVARGDVVATPGAFGATSRFDGELRCLARNQRPLKHRERLHLHTGTSEVIGRVLLLESPEIAPGATGLVQFQAESELALGPRDHFIVRSYSPVLTLGGGVVIDAHPPYRRRRPGSRSAGVLVERLRTLRHGDPVAIALRLMYQGTSPVSRQDLSGRLQVDLSRSAGAVGELLASLLELDLAVSLGSDSGHLMTREAWNEAVSRTGAYLADYHQRWPLRPGATRDEVRVGALGLGSPRDFAGILTRLGSDGHLTIQGDRLALPSFAPSPQGAYGEAAGRLVDLYCLAGASPPGRGEASEQLRAVVPQTLRRSWEMHYPELLAYLVAQGELVQVSGDLLFAKAVVDRIRAELAGRLSAQETFSVSDFRQWVGTSRKYAVPLLEYFDQIGVTRRQGDVRAKGPALRLEGADRDE